MTIAFIAACKDRFYLISDTLTSRFGPKSDQYLLNSQKVFYSDKHKIALSTSGQANLIYKPGGAVKDDMLISHVLRQFFQHLDTLPDVKIDELQKLLVDFVDHSFPDYQNFFRFQNPGSHDDKDVDFFYAGFYDNGSGNKETKIFAHFDGVDKETKYDSDHPFFSNSPKAVDYYVINIGTQGAPDPNVAIVELLDKHDTSYVLNVAVPMACIALNTDSLDDTGTYCIGHKLHRVSITPAGLTEDYVQYDAYSGDINKYNTQACASITYTQYDTLQTLATSITGGNEQLYDTTSIVGMP